MQIPVAGGTTLLYDVVAAIGLNSPDRFLFPRTIDFQVLRNTTEIVQYVLLPFKERLPIFVETINNLAPLTREYGQKTNFFLQFLLL